METNKKIFPIAVIIIGVLTLASVVLYFNNYVTLNIVMLLMGFSQLFSGLNQYQMSKFVDSKGKHKGNKIVGIVSIVLGLFIIIAVFTDTMF